MDLKMRAVASQRDQLIQKAKVGVCSVCFRNSREAEGAKWDRNVDGRSGQKGGESGQIASPGGLWRL